MTASDIPKVKFFLTGRPEPRIAEGFRLPLLAKLTDVFVLHGVSQDQVGNDIQLFFKSPQTRRWVELQEQEAVALCASNLHAPGSCPTYQDAGEEPSSSSGGGERGSFPGDGGLEIGAGSGAGGVGPRCAGVPGVCVPPTDNEVELLLFFALSSRAPSSPVLE